MADQHRTPSGDHIEHELTDDCVCGPRVERVLGTSVIVHHSLDGREMRERRGFVSSAEYADHIEREQEAEGDP